MQSFPGDAVVKKLPASTGDRVWVRSLSQEELLEKELATLYSCLLRASMAEDLTGYSSWGHNE